MKKSKNLAFRPFKENSKPNITQIWKKPFKYIVNKEEIDVLYWVRWSSYDFIFGVPSKKNKYKDIEKGFFQYRNMKKKKVVCGFYIDRKELNELIKGFQRIKKIK